MDVNRTGVEFGPLEIGGLTLNPIFHFYGLLAVTGILVATHLMVWLAKKDGKNPDPIWNGLIWAVVAGIVGARLWHILFLPVTSIEAGKDTMWMLRNFLDFQNGPLAIWNGGLGIYGGAIGGFVGILLYAYKVKLPNLWEWVDLAAIVFPLGHGIARWGNYVNQELYGKPTDLPWAIRIDHPPATYVDAAGFHPLFFYEFVWNTLICLVLVRLWLLYRRNLVPGTFLLLYLILYNSVRFGLEFLRIETARVYGTGINSSQLISGAAVLISLSLLIYIYKLSSHSVRRSQNQDAQNKRLQQELQ